jgi:hypothetical protein
VNYSRHVRIRQVCELKWSTSQNCTITGWRADRCRPHKGTNAACAVGLHWNRLWPCANNDSMAGRAQVYTRNYTTGSNDPTLLGSTVIGCENYISVLRLPKRWIKCPYRTGLLPYFWWYAVLYLYTDHKFDIRNTTNISFSVASYILKLTDSTSSFGLPHTHTVSYPLPELSFCLPNMAALYYNHSTLTVKQSQANCLTTRLVNPLQPILLSRLSTRWICNSSKVHENE